MTPEQQDARKRYQREYARERRAAMTPEQLGAYNAYQREHQRTEAEHRYDIWHEQCEPQ